ncbi:MAG TPA: cytochrome c3 family protein [Polyangiaceae bacterium]|jgi:hypothetical protein
MKTPVKGAVLATMVATLFGCGGGQPPPPTAPTTTGTVRCVGVNECRARSDCGGIAGATCAATNSCRGKGWIKVAVDVCASKGGHPLGGDWRPATSPGTAGGGPKTCVAPGKTTMLPALQRLGIDVAADTDLTALPLAKKRKVMQLFVKALGTTCDTCHEEDFKADTRNKRVARRMWSDFVAVLRETDGAPVFCDSCHQGHVKILAREDDKVLAAYMKASYVERLARADGAEQKCATCHGDPFEPDIFGKRFEAR